MNLSSTQPMDLSQPSGQPGYTPADTSPRPAPQPPTSTATPPAYINPTFQYPQYNLIIPQRPKIKIPRENKSASKSGGDKQKMHKLLPAPHPPTSLVTSTPSSGVAFSGPPSQSASHKMLLLMQSSQNVMGPQAAVGSSASHPVRLKAAVASPAIQAALSSTSTKTSTSQSSQVEIS